jgi:uroporphyrinogen III methyltransferase/synthase
VVFVGAGPAGANLLTAEAAKWLARADVVLYDRLISADVLALAGDKARKVYVGKDSSGDADTQEHINDLLVREALAGRLVIRLKGGDPFVFGRGGEEADALDKAGVSFRIVPGLTAALAAGAYAGIPLTQRGMASTLALVTGHEDPTKEDSAVDWSALARIDTVVVYMGVGNLAEIAARLVSGGRAADTPAAVVHRAGDPRQKTVTGTLATIASAAGKAGIAPPALLIVGDSVVMRETLCWFERLPLFGQTVLVTRARAQASVLSQRLAELGAHVIEAPCIEIAPTTSHAALDKVIRRPADFDWIVLTSPNGVEPLFARLDAAEHDARALAGVKIAAVGEATAAALAARGIRADLVPADFTTESLAAALCQLPTRLRRRVLLVRAQDAPRELTEAIVHADSEVVEAPAYRTMQPASLPEEAVAALAERRVNWITFTSSSTVENFLALASDADLSGVKLAAIGPVTAQTMRKHKLIPHVVADEHTIDGLVDAMLP